jgi:oligopeptidase B
MTIENPPVPAVPDAERRPLTRTHHGDAVVDDYEWLRDREDPAVVALLEAENTYADARLAGLEPLRQAIFGEIKARTKETDLSVPSREGDWWYFSRSEEGKQYARHCRAPISGPDDWKPPVLKGAMPGEQLPGEQILLDDDAEAAGHEFYSLGSFDITPDGRLLLWAVDTVGDERYVLHVKDLETGERLPDVIEGTMPGALFDADGTGIYYTTCDEAWRPDTVLRHALGAEGDDEVLFTEPDERYWVGVGMTRSRRYVEIGVGSKVTTESRLLDTQHPEAGFRVVWPRREGVEYSVEHAVLEGRDRLLILHNDGAEDFELVAVDPADPEGERNVLLPSSPGVRLEEVDAFSRFVAVSYREGGLARVGLLAPSGIDEIDFDEPLFTAGIGSNPEWEQPTLRIGYGSLVTPSTVLDLDVVTGARTVLKQQPVLGGYDPAAYRERREWATAEDGTRVPISIVGRADLMDGRESPAPMLLYGYGSYEASIDPSFSIARLSLLDRGVLFAIAHVRGGGEMGRHWYEQGKTLTKRNTFTDFVASARHLIAEGWTEPSRLVAEGAWPLSCSPGSTPACRSWTRSPRSSTRRCR